jgi:VWFA-related protein
LATRAGGLVILGTAALALASSITVSAQPGAAPGAPASPPLVIRVGVDLIQIDAAVTDKQGRPVTDLRAEDFTLEVDGQKQPITNAAHFGRSLDAGDEGAPATANPYAETVVVFVIDDLNMSYKSMYDTKRSLARFAEEMGPARPLMALRLTSDESPKFSLYRSADRLASAVSGLKYNVLSSKGVFPENPVAAPAFMGAPADITAQNRTPSRTGPVLTSGPTPSQETQNLRQRAFSLVSTINTLRGFPGRKAVVLVSEGFWVDNETRERFGRGFPLSAIFDDTDYTGAARMVTEVANRASVVLYPVDPRGPMEGVSSVADSVTALQATDQNRAKWESRTGSQASLQYLAEDTGGLANATRNDLQGGFGDVLRDQTAYYLIGFEPPQKTFARSSGRPKFHKIRLSVNRPDVRVRTRAGFYGVTDEEVFKRAPVMTSPE